MEKKPKGVFIVAIIVLIAAVLAMIVGISTIIPGTPLDVIWTLKNSFPAGFRSTLFGMIFGYFILILALVMFYAVYGLIKGRKSAWCITIIIFTVNGIGDAISVASDGSINGIFGILFVTAFLLYLTRPRVRKFFEK